MIPWVDAERRLREKSYAELDADPQILLERDAWFDVDADLFHARMIGFDEQVVREWWIPKVVPVLLEAIPRPMALARADADEVAPGVYRVDGVDLYFPVDESELLYMRTARYVLQSGFVVVSVAAEVTTPPVPPRPDQTVKVAYLRYRRRA